jgi:hypothetical protein
MSTDLRTELNDCDNVTGFLGDGNSPALNTLTGQRYEGTGAISTQHTNADEHMWTTQTSGGGGTFNLDLSDSTVYILIKDNLVDTYANGGMQISLGDGTDDIGYDVAGNDAVGLTLSPYYNCVKLDVSEAVATPGGFTTYAGAEANLNHAAVTSVGYGSLHLAKAQGNVDNVFLDRITYIANGSYALRINGGTVGTPETMADVQGDDVTNGWGLIANPVGDQYQFFGPTEWGEPAANADVYFTATNEQWYWIGDNAGGRALGATHFPFRVVGNATDTVSFVLDNVVIVNTGTRAQFDMSNADVDTLQLDAVTFTDLGTITFPANTGSKYCDDSIFNNCDQVYLDDLTCDGLVFNGSNDANGAVLWDGGADPSAQDNITFNSDGTGHAIEIALDTAALTTFNIDGYTVTGYETTSGGSTGNTVFLIDNLQDGDVTINVSNGSGTFSYEAAAGYTGTVTINQTVTVTVTVLDEDGNAVEGARVRAEESAGGALVTQGSTNASGVYTDNVSVSTPLSVLIKCRLKGFRNFRTTGTIQASGLDVGVRFVADPIVDLP